MGSFYMESTQINYRRDETVKTVDQKLQELSETSAIDTDIAPVFKSTNTYAPGDMVYYRNKLYVFNVEHSGAWAAGDVTATDVTTEVSSLRSGLTNATTVSSGTITAQEGVTITNYTLQKSLNTVYLYMLVKFTPTLGTPQLLCILPRGYRAQSRLLFAGKNGTSGKLVTCEVDNWGAVRVDPTSEDSSAVPTDYFLTITYFTS